MGNKMKGKLTRITGIYTLLDKDGRMIASDDVDFQKDYQINKLSKQNCDEIFGVFDVEKLADEHITHNEDIPQEIKRWLKISYKIAFNKAMELNKDKVFTLKDVRKLLRLVHILPNFELEQFEDENNVLQIDDFISHHLQQPTEIEVEIVMGDPIGITDNYTPDTFPKLDENNCLILKKL
jgi:hypothetical protein